MPADDRTAANKAIAIEAITRVFINRDASAPGELFHADYRQHNPAIPNGNAALPGLIAALPADFRYEMGMVAAEGDLVMIHGRYTGWAPRPMVAVDIFRIADGKLAEHWDVMQEEVPAAQSVSGNAMFDR